MSVTNRLPVTVDEFLQSTDAYPDHPAQVELRETHISRVFLTDRFAYKLKKPVKFDFLDFSRLEWRKRACQAELELNRRLAHQVYLAVVPVCRQADGGLRLGGDGVPVEWLVKMRRLDDERSLEWLIQQRALNHRQLTCLATRLAEFYTSQPPAVVKSSEYRLALQRHIAANRDALLRLVIGEADAIEFSFAAQMRYAHLLSDVLGDRVCDGRVVDGHGDLRPEHIYFENEPLIIDCIEFNTEYRENDILDELGFLSMECDLLGADRIGDTVLESYMRASNDRPHRSLVQFYKCYRACVRAKVTALQHPHASDAGRRSARYLDLAKQYASHLGPKLVLALGGASGSGKSTIATQLAERLHGRLLRTDLIRDELFEGNGQASYAEGRYSPDARGQVYDEMIRRIAPAMNVTPTVVLDGTFPSSALRRQAMQAAHDLGAELVHVHCHCPPKVALLRIAERQHDGGDASDARPSFYQRQCDELEPYGDTGAVIEIDTTLPIESQTDAVEDHVRHRATDG